MTSRSYFGKMNSTLGSVVPLAMFVSIASRRIIVKRGMSKRRAGERNGGRGNEDNACSPVVVKYNPGEIEEIQEGLRGKGLRKLRKQVELEESTTQEEAVNIRVFQM